MPSVRTEKGFSGGAARQALVTINDDFLFIVGDCRRKHRECQSDLRRTGTDHCGTAARYGGQSAPSRGNRLVLACLRAHRRDLARAVALVDAPPGTLA